MMEIVQERETFALRLEQLRARTTYLALRKPCDLNRIYRLRYDANLREGTILPSPEAMLKDRFDETANAFNIGIFIDHELTAALRLHVLSPDYSQSPALDAFPDLISPLLDAGATFIDTTRLAANFPRARAFPHLPYVTLRLGIMAARHFNADYVTGACRAEHFPFYEREFKGLRACPPRPYPTLVKPLCLVLIDFKKHGEAIVARRPIYGSTVEERASVFKAPAASG